MSRGVSWAMYRTPVYLYGGQIAQNGVAKASRWTGAEAGLGRDESSARSVEPDEEALREPTRANTEKIQDSR